MKKSKFLKISICLALVLVMAFTATACNKTLEIEGIDMISTLSIDVGDEYALQASLLPFGAEGIITYRTSDATIATVSADGTVKGVAAGTALIRASAGEKFADCTVTVNDPSQRVVVVTQVTLNIGVLNLEVDETSTLTATVTPENATDKTITWVSSKPTVATVDDGLVTAVAPGTTIITATSNNNQKATCLVKVAGDAGDDAVSTLHVR